jgi:hypothetical protein
VFHLLYSNSYSIVHEVCLFNIFEVLVYIFHKIFPFSNRRPNYFSYIFGNNVDLPKRRRRFFSKIVIKTTDGYQDTLIGKLPRTQDLIVHIISKNITEIVGPTVHFQIQINENHSYIFHTNIKSYFLFFSVLCSTKFSIFCIAILTPSSMKSVSSTSLKS